MASRSTPTTALVLAAGLGTRLRPLTTARAKPSLPVAGTALLLRIVEALARQQIRDLIVNLHYRPETLTTILGDGSQFGVRVRYSWEQPLLGSAGGPRRAFALDASPRLLLVNGDTLTDVDVSAVIAAHAASDAEVTMAVIPNPDPSRYGGVIVGDNGIVTGFTGRGGAGPSWHFVGVQVAERTAFRDVADGATADSVGGIYRSLLASRPTAIRAFCSTASFQDIGTPRDYLETCLTLADGVPTALLAPDVAIGRGATLDRSVVWEDVAIGDDAELSRCVVMSGARVPAGFVAHERVIESDLTSTPLT